MRNKWTLLAFVAAIHVTYVVARSLLGVLAVPIQAETGLDNVAFGVLTAAIFWTHSAVVPFAGFAGDRLNRVRLIAVAAMAWSAMTVLAGFATGFWSLLLLASVAVIVPQTVFGPTACALLSDHHRETRTVALSCHQAAYYAGWFASGASVAAILALFGSWRAPFVVVGAVGFALGLAFLCLFGRMRAASAVARAAAAKPTFARSLAAFFGCRSARLLAVGYIADIFVIFGYSSWGPKFVAEKFGLSPAAAGTGVMFWHYAASFAAVIVSGVVTDRLVKRYPRFRLALGLGAMLAAIPALVGFGFAPTVTLTWVSAAVLGLALGAFGSNMVSAVYDVVPAQYRAGAVGFLNVLAAFVASFAPIALGALSARLGTRGFELGFALMGAVTFVAALAYGVAAVFTFNADRKSADQV